MKKAVIICGPTASGKTNFAHKFAKKYGGEIINADSMQIYKQIPIITASPSEELKRELPYHLYNVQDVVQEFSAVKYIKRATDIIKQVSCNKSLPVIVGGSGMYISMLINGYSEIPAVDENIRTQVRCLHQQIGAADFYRKLTEIDSQMATILNMGDTQRVIRAYEVFMQTGKSILHFQQENIKPLPEYDFKIILLLPERKFLYETCNNRLIGLFQSGAIAEVEKMHTQFPKLETSASKALGVSEITSYLKGEISIDKALELSSVKTRQYAKRQCTWFNNQIEEKQILTFSSMATYNNLII
ncbi:MAG: tRNA (adenosine(37)-N6)-dimethylallyltransferase MiaA [Rickettsiales bacterium]|nr:MAG: tRNA (adenosine(37)-N6)-dimethylallyltransferase MiaA [Rickettsiales bacterium]